LPRELPAAVTVETARLEFQTLPLSNKGLLSQQVRDALKTLARQSKDTPVVKLRAFVAGTGDMRRVPTIVGEVFTEKRQALPALTVVQVGALPLEGAQVAIEAILIAKKPVNPHGLALISSRAAVSANPIDPVAPLAEKAAADLHAAVGAADVLRLTCYASALDHKAAASLRALFPKAAFQMVQAVRAPSRAFVECEAVARLARAPVAPAQSVAGVAEITAPRLVLSGSQLGFHTAEADVRLAFERLEKALAAAHIKPAHIVYAQYYPLTRGMLERIAKIQTEFFSKSQATPATAIVVEGLPSVDASFAMDVVAALP
jgi:enamine deaminase RidA (YjgF/YER057c/UK114 family)